LDGEVPIALVVVTGDVESIANDVLDGPLIRMLVPLVHP
jgi:hypothetical protein